MVPNSWCPSFFGNSRWKWNRCLLYSQRATASPPDQLDCAVAGVGWPFCRCELCLVKTHAGSHDALAQRTLQHYVIPVCLVDQQSLPPDARPLYLHYEAVEIRSYCDHQTSFTGNLQCLAGRFLVPLPLLYHLHQTAAFREWQMRGDFRDGRLRSHWDASHAHYGVCSWEYHPHRLEKNARNENTAETAGFQSKQQKRSSSPSPKGEKLNCEDHWSCGLNVHDLFPEWTELYCPAPDHS